MEAGGQEEGWECVRVAEKYCVLRFVVAHPRPRMKEQTGEGQKMTCLLGWVALLMGLKEALVRQALVRQALVSYMIR